jgi:hypothetical protein
MSKVINPMDALTLKPWPEAGVQIQHASKANITATEIQKKQEELDLTVHYEALKAEIAQLIDEQSKAGKFHIALDCSRLNRATLNKVGEYLIRIGYKHVGLYRERGLILTCQWDGEYDTTGRYYDRPVVVFNGTATHQSKLYA